ncbi:TPA: hypothetical protein HA235_07730 [Candidatus Woesearchaeota archaeon]|nr:hypothetical protein [Candidatus Woesearchaeota archaeon]HIH32569.1 hypothetical protein [Candidatus Woesearchaeota archaeon]HIH54804.1 hypothetical protein [Candidatus Woesearchaeota archaeon]HIJ02152.1 hypothetical protein [Candidatus Woesearchaeota archaeon]HIJ13642.1 hypothetical protein [Candidatus Woesearchaeota archaeon]
MVSLTFFNIDEYVHSSVSEENLKRLKSLLRDVYFSVKDDHTENFKLFMNNVWSSIYIYLTSYTPLVMIEISMDKAKASSNSNGRYDIFHRNGTKYSVFTFETP